MSLTNVYRMIAKGVSDGQDIINHLDYIPTAVGGSVTEVRLEDMTALALVFSVKWIDEVLDAIGATYSIREWRCQEITDAVLIPGPPPRYEPVFGRSVVEFDTAPSVGLRPAPVSPTTEAANLRKVTGVGTRYGRGSMRLGPLSEADSLNNTFTQAYVGILEAVGLELAETLTTRGGTVNEILWTPVVYSAALEVLQTPATPKSATNNIVAIVPNPLVTTQRSRHRRI